MSSSVVANGVCKTHYLNQVYVRNEGIALVSKLPPSARATLRYYETAATTHAFTPLSPLSGSKLDAQAYYHFAVTDWALYVLARTSSSDTDGLLLELPWLSVKDLGIQELDCGEVLEPVNGRQVRANLISVYPQVDVHRLPADTATKLQRVSQALAGGASAAEAAEAAEDIPWYRRLFGGGGQPSRPSPARPASAQPASPQQHAGASAATATARPATAQQPGEQGPWASSVVSSGGHYGAQPAAQRYAGQPAAQQYVGQAAAQQYGGQPAAQQYAGQAAAQQYEGQPAAQQYAGRPAAQQYVGQPAAQQYMGQPAAQQYRGEPAAQQYVGQPAAQQYGGQPAPQQYGGQPAPQQYGGQPAAQQYGGQPAPQQYGGQPAPQQYGGQPAPQQYRGQPASQQCGGQPAAQQYVGQAAAQQYGGQAAVQQYGAQPASQQYWGQPAAQQYPFQHSHQPLWSQSLAPGPHSAQRVPLGESIEHCATISSGPQYQRVSAHQQYNPFPSTTDTTTPYHTSGTRNTTPIPGHNPWAPRAVEPNPWQQSGSLPLRVKVTAPCSGYSAGKPDLNTAVDSYPTPRAGIQSQGLYMPAPGTPQSPSADGMESSSPASVWLAGGAPHRTQWAPPARLPPPAPLDMRAPVLPAVPQPVGEERWPDHVRGSGVEAVDIALHDYALVLITVEHRTHLAYHMRAAWLGAHMRWAVSRAAFPGTPLWYTPPGLAMGRCMGQPSGAAAPSAQQQVLRYLAGGRGASAGSLPSAGTAMSTLFPGRVRTGHPPLVLSPSSTAAPFAAPWHDAPSASLLASEQREVALLVERLAAHAVQAVSSRQVVEIWERAESVLMRGCSLWEDTDTAIMQDLLLHVGLASGPAAHAHSAAFFRRPWVMAFIVSRLYAWGAVCALWGPELGAKAAKKAVTPYVQWVLSRNQGLKDAHGRGVGEMLAPQMTPWSAANAGSGTPAAHPWDSPAYDTAATPRPALQPPSTPTEARALAPTARPGAPFSHAPGYALSGGGGAAQGGQWRAGERVAASGGFSFWPQQGAGTQAPHPGLARSRPPSLMVPPEPQGPTPYTPSRGHTPHLPFQKPPDDPDKLSGRKATADEDAYAFFLHLYRMHTWREGERACGGQLQRLLLALGLAKGCPPSINVTVRAVKAIISQQARRSGPAARSKPPPVQAPPTLAPSDPLSLSPLTELPYLFVLEVPEAAAATERALSGTEDGPGQGQEGTGLLGGSGEQVLERARQRAQEQLQGTSIGRLLQSRYLEGALGGGDPEMHSRTHSKTQERWERLVGRLAAAAAWRKLQVLLGWVSGLMQHSEGCEDRQTWCSDEVVETDGSVLAGGTDDTGSGGLWTRRRCSRHMVNLITQLRDPAGPSSLQLVLPQSPTDLTWWCRAEAGSVWLDAASAILWHLSSLSLGAGGGGRAAGRHRPAQRGSESQGMGPRNVMLEGLRELPLPLAHAFCRRLLCRLCALRLGHAAVHRGSREHDGDMADAAAFQLGEVLLLLLNKVPRAAMVLHDALDHRLFHTLRTPQLTSALSQRSSSHHVLGHMGHELLAEVLAELEGAGPEARPGSLWQAGLSQPQITNVGSMVGRHKMPGVMI